MPTQKQTNKKTQQSNNLDNYKKLGTRVQPNSMDAEVAVLGAMMLDKLAISNVRIILSAESFYYPNHQLLYQAIIDMDDKGIPVDLVSLNDELTRRKILTEIGGTFYIADINAKTPTAANVEFHARIVQEKYLKRALISASANILERCYDDSTDALDEIDVAEAEIFRIAESRFSSSYVDIKKLTHEAVDLVAKMAERDKNTMNGVPTGFKDLDEKLGGFQNSDLIIIAARPSMGKTAFAMSIARNVAVEYKLPVAFFSIEMSDIQLVIRLFSGEAKINAQKIRTGNINHQELAKLVKKINRLADSPLYIDDSPMLSINDFRAKCRRLKVERNIKMVMIDYLQLIQPPKAESREREISIISRSLKQIAKELDIPIVAMAQLNRSVEQRTEKRPQLSDLRESGSIEQDADVVLFIYRPEVYGIKTYTDNQAPTENTGEIIIGKQRNGPTGFIRLVYEKDYTRFENGEFGYSGPPPELENSNFDPDYEERDKF